MQVESDTSKPTPIDTIPTAVRRRNVISFLILGLCNNYVLVLMLSGAQDLLAKDDPAALAARQNHSDHCLEDLNARHCTKTSTGLVLICNILGSLTIKAIGPFFIHRVPYGVRLLVVCSAQTSAIFLAALAPNVPLTLVGVLVASFAAGLGEMSLLSLASHFPRSTILGWSSGTGLAGLAGSLIYAVLTDVRLLAFSSSTALLLNLAFPVIYFITYFVVLVYPSTVKKACLFSPSSWFDFKKSSKVSPNYQKQINEPNTQKINKMEIFKGVSKFYLSIFIIYFSQYFINQGLLELTLFDCTRAFGMGPAAMYRYYQVLYQTGVFISRSSLPFFSLNLCMILSLPWMQASLMILFCINTFIAFIPHFAVAAGLVFIEGLIAGSSYSNIYNHIYKSYDIASRERAVSYVASADGFGILLAAISALPVHDTICKVPLKHIWN
ncbi:hypothetical protein WR25_21903 isoform B [Diploscapter pachys]|uniref:Battenin n=1 Tax=Diploscapter pachys TaxID=2018661 RepID=A0A2A2LYW2_9BILA|nr:hypothetical protein WR25_21903 isoform B [Diploscapter pachys]